MPGTSADPFAEPAIAAVPADWVAALPGQVIAATHVAFLPEADPPWDLEEIAARLFGGNPLVGARGRRRGGAWPSPTSASTPTASAGCWCWIAA